MEDFTRALPGSLQIAADFLEHTQWDTYERLAELKPPDFEPGGPIVGL